MFLFLRKYLEKQWKQLTPSIGRTTITSLFILGQIPVLPVKNYVNFSDWCLNYSQLSPDAKNTVKTLVDLSLNNNFDGDSVSWQKVVDTNRCFIAEKALAKKKSLSFEQNEQISNLAPLATLKNLRELNIERQAINDLSPLATLTQLKKLNLSRNLINDITPLSSLENLKKLDLSHNLIHFLTPLSSLENLEKLNIESASVSNIEALNSLIRLKKLNLAGNRINSVEPLSSLYSLEKLDLSQNVIRDISSLSSLDNMVELKVENNYIPPESQICPVKQQIACNDIYSQRVANYSIEKIDIFQRQRQILKRNRQILRRLRNQNL